MKNQITYNSDNQQDKDIERKLELKNLDKNSKNLYYSKAIELGKGAFGQVFLGYAQNEQRPFACKIISFSKLQNNPESLMKKIKEQIVNMQIAKNERIVELYETKMSPNHIYILCQYCNGENMQIFLKNRSYLTETQSINFFKEILEGFSQLRERNIVHRDMKLANLLLHNYSIKIADLGFSKSIENHQQLLDSIVGSPAYMSPQILQKEKYTEKTDIWSLGIILFEMLYGHNPFSNCINLMQLKECIKKQISFPSYPYVSERTKETIKKMLKIKQQERISWQLLFNKYLKDQEVNIQLEQNYLEDKLTYTMSSPFYHHFRSTYFIQSYLHLNKIIPILGIYTKQQLKNAFPSYSNKIQFFLQYKYITEQKQKMIDHFNYYIQYRNQISYLIILNQKLSKTITQYNNIYYRSYIYCLIMLNFRYTISLIQDLISKKDNQNFQNTKTQQYFWNLLIKLFITDKAILQNQYKRFNEQFFTIFFNNLKMMNFQLYLMINDELSGIYNNSKGDTRVIKFFITNYMKKVFNFLKQIIPKQKNQFKNIITPSSMISEEEEYNQNGPQVQKHEFPSNQFTIVRLINEYLSNQQLFNLRIQEPNKRLTNQNLSSFRKNLNQILFDFQNIMNTKYYEEISYNPPFKEQSINQLINKEFKWNSFIFSKLL